MKEVKMHDTDTGSPAVQVALLTRSIEELTDHLKKHRKDNHSAADYLKWSEKESACWTISLKLMRSLTIPQLKSSDLKIIPTFQSGLHLEGRRS